MFSLPANGINRASGSAPRSPDRRARCPGAVDAPRSGTGAGEEKEDEAIEDRRLAHVHDGPKALGKVADEISSRHFTRRYEGGEPREQADRNEKSADQLNDRGCQDHRRERMRHSLGKNGKSE